jgi:hypothetical protein
MNDKPFDFACAGYGWYTISAGDYPEIKPDAVIRCLYTYEMMEPDEYHNAVKSADCWSWYNEKRFERGHFQLVGWAYGDRQTL